MTDFDYESSDRVLDGTPEKPSRPRYAWEIQRLDPVGKANDEDHELFFLTERVAGRWVKDDKTEEYQTVYVPRPAGMPPIPRVSLKYLDDNGSMQDEIRRGRSE